MEMQNETQQDLIDVCEPVKKKMGRPRIHPVKPPKENKYSSYLEDPKAYCRQYYSVHTKTILLCPTCESEFSCKSSYTRHVRCNKNCIITRLQQQLSNNAGENPNLISKKHLHKRGFKDIDYTSHNSRNI